MFGNEAKENTMEEKPEIVGSVDFDESQEQKKQTKPFAAKKKKKICTKKFLEITYKDVEILSQFLTITAKIKSSKITKLCSKAQRRVANAIKIARIMALLPFTDR